jgi:hypothetical protein
MRDKPMKNKLSDLNNHLFAQLERLSDEDLKADELKSEIERSKAVTRVAREIVVNGRLALDAQKCLGESISSNQLPSMLEAK